MATYTYADCLANSYKVNWRIEDVIGGKAFDPGRPWLPAGLSGAGGCGSLSDEEKRQLTHVEMGAYAYLFGFVEEFIAPEILALARDFEIEQRDAFDALTNFAAEEVKHMNLFREVREMVNAALGTPQLLLGNEKDVARAVLSKSRGAVLLLTAAIEWFTQRHYLEGFKDDTNLDQLTKDIFRAHWQEESQHARMDHLETLRAFEGLSDAEKDQAIDELIELVGAVDGLLQQQSENDVQTFQQYSGRTLTEAERADVYDSVLKAKRWVFIESGVTHPNFQELFGEVTTPAQQEKVGAALQPILSAA